MVFWPECLRVELPRSGTNIAIACDDMALRIQHPDRPAHRHVRGRSGENVTDFKGTPERPDYIALPDGCPTGHGRALAAL